MILGGLDAISGKDMSFTTEGVLKEKINHDSTQTESTKKKKGGWLKGKSTKQKSETHETLNRSTFKSGGDILFQGIGDVHFQPADVESEGSTQILSLEGKVYMEAAASTHAKSEQKMKENIAWQKQQDKGWVDKSLEQTL